MEMNPSAMSIAMKDMGYLIEAAQANMKYLPGPVVNVKGFGAKGDGISDDTHEIQQALSFAATFEYVDVIFPDSTYLISGITIPNTFKGTLTGPGVLKAIPGESIPQLISMDKCSDVSFSINIDMSQTAQTVPTDNRCEIGIYINDCRNINILNVDYVNCRVGRPFFISGTSSNNPTPSNGSKNITVDNNRIFGIEYPFVDEGCYPVIRSDFYSSDGGGVYYFASNGVKVSDLTIDTNVWYPPTTSNINISNLYAKHCDRIAVLNVENINFVNCTLIDFWTRGYNFSPTCNNYNVTGGKITGGDASQLANAYRCTNGNFSNINVYPIRPTGEKSALKAVTGCENINFSNINGEGNFDNSIYVHSSKNISFSGINLKRNDITLVRSMNIMACSEDTPATTYNMSGIKFVNCYLEGNAILRLKSNISGALIETGGVTFENCEFFSLGNFFTTDSDFANGLGCLKISNCKFTSSGSTNTVLPSKILASFQNNTGLMMQRTDQITVASPTIIHTFPNVYYYVPIFGNGSTAGDNTRDPEVSLYKDGVLLIYGIDWFCDGAMATSRMVNQIRLYSSSTVPAGSKLTFVRNN